MPLIAAIHTNNLSRFISGFVGPRAMIGWAGTLVLVAAVEVRVASVAREVERLGRDGPSATLTTTH